MRRGLFVCRDLWSFVGNEGVNVIMKEEEEEVNQRIFIFFSLTINPWITSSYYIFSHSFGLQREREVAAYRRTPLWCGLLVLVYPLLFGWTFSSLLSLIILTQSPLFPPPLFSLFIPVFLNSTQQWLHFHFAKALNYWVISHDSNQSFYSSQKSFLLKGNSTRSSKENSYNLHNFPSLPSPYTRNSKLSYKLNPILLLALLNPT